MDTTQNHVPLWQLPDGTLLETTVYIGILPVKHFGFVGRLNGLLLVHHSSKALGRPASTSFEEFAPSGQAKVLSTPENAQQGWLITQRAFNEIVRGIPWSLDHNCEDFVSRVLTGQEGSPTRSAIGGLSLAGLIIALLASL